MIKTIFSVLLLSMTVSTLAADLKPTKANMSVQSADQKAAELVVRNYMQFLHVADTEGIMNLYDADAVFMPADAPTLEGKVKIKESYAANFKMMQIPDGESILEEVTIQGNLAIVRLATKSTVLILANSQKITVNARELFILKKIDENFKISRYMFNSTQAK